MKSTACPSFRRMCRREFFQVGGASLFGLSMADQFRTRVEAAGSKTKPQANHLIVLWLGGGPPHIDMFDLKPEAPAEIRGEFKPIATNVPGIEIGELLPKLAKIADKYCILRSMSSKEIPHDHNDGTGWLTGTRRAPPITPLYPNFGGVMAHERPAKGGLPSFVSFGRFGHNDSYLGPVYQPMFFNPTDPKDEVRKMLTAPQLDLPSLERREELRQTLARQLHQQEAQTPLIAGLSEYEQKAFDLLRAPKLQQALNVEGEWAKDSARYGNNAEGKKLLVTRRLVEAGVPVVFTNLAGDWDFHGNNAGGCKRALPIVDSALSAFLEDLDARGLLAETIVLMLGEFGRTPKHNKGAGRDHWLPACSILAAGGGFKGGAVVGATDKHAEQITRDYYNQISLARTIYHLLGIDPDKELHATDGRPFKIIPDEAPLIRQALA